MKKKKNFNVTKNMLQKLILNQSTMKPQESDKAAES